MKGIIEQEIEEFADKTGEYPKRVEVSQKEWDILQNELKRELIELNTKSIIFINEDIHKFRGCELVLNRKLSKFRIS